MAIEPKYEKVVSSERVKLGTTQAVIECRLPASDSSEIAKILCANAKSFIVNTEAKENEVEFLGNVNFQVIYENADGVANGLDYTADFKDKFSNNAITPQSVPIVQSVVVDVNTTINGNDVKVVAIVEISVEIIKTQEVNALTGATGDNVFLDMAQLKVPNFVGMLYDKFDSTYDIEIKDNV